MKKTFYFLFFAFGITLITVMSCNTDNFDSITAIEVTAEPSQILAGDSFTFFTKANNGDDLTSEASFIVNGESITGNTFTSSEVPQTYQVQATYKDFVSEIVTVSTSTGFVKNVLIEDYTGTWCGWCPRVAYAIHEAKENEIYGDKIVSVAIHIDDEMAFDKSNVLKEAFTPEFSGLPQGNINRINTWTSPETENLDDAYNRTGYYPIGIALESELIENTINASINVQFLTDITLETKIVVYLVENGLHFSQYNYTSDLWSEGIEHPIADFEHNDVLRAVFTDIYGVGIPSDQQTLDNTYTYELTATVPSSVTNTDELLLIAFVVNADSNEVLNVRESHLGITQEFQLE